MARVHPALLQDGEVGRPQVEPPSSGAIWDDQIARTIPERALRGGEHVRPDLVAIGGYRRAERCSDRRGPGTGPDHRVHGCLDDPAGRPAPTSMDAGEHPRFGADQHDRDAVRHHDGQPDPGIGRQQRIGIGDGIVARPRPSPPVLEADTYDGPVVGLPAEHQIVEVHPDRSRRAGTVLGDPFRVVADVEAEVQRGVRPGGAATIAARDDRLDGQVVEQRPGQYLDPGPTLVAVVAVRGDLSAGGDGRFHGRETTAAAWLVDRSRPLTRQQGRPGFQPFARFTLGLVNGSPTWRAGPLDAGGGGTYLAAQDLIVTWSTISWGGVLVGVVAGVAGGLLMAINRTVLTAGVMVALALVPTAALVPMALVAGDPVLAAGTALRFAVEVLLVLVTTAVVFALETRADSRHSVR